MKDIEAVLGASKHPSRLVLEAELKADPCLKEEERMNNNRNNATMLTMTIDPIRIIILPRLMAVGRRRLTDGSIRSDGMGFADRLPHGSIVVDGRYTEGGSRSRRQQQVAIDSNAWRVSKVFEPPV